MERNDELVDLELEPGDIIRIEGIGKVSIMELPDGYILFGERDGELISVGLDLSRVSFHPNRKSVSISGKYEFKPLREIGGLNSVARAVYDKGLRTILGWVK